MHWDLKGLGEGRGVLPWVIIEKGEFEGREGMKGVEFEKRGGFLVQKETIF